MPLHSTDQSVGNEGMRHNLWLRILKLINVALITLPFAVCWFKYYAERLYSPFYFWGNVTVVALFVALYVIFGRVYSAFTISIQRISAIVYSQTLAIIFSNILLYVVTWLLMKFLPAVWPYLLVVGAQILLSLLWAVITHKIYFHFTAPVPTAVIWDMREGVDNLVHSYGMDKRFLIQSNVNVNEAVDNLDEHLAGVRAIFLCGIHSKERNVIIKHCVNNQIRAYIIPRVGDVLMSGAKQVHLFHLPILMLERYNPSPEYLFFKRLFDIVASGIALVILSPLMLVVALIIKSDGGPAFYRQRRLTKDGKEFDVLKFRSMRVDAEKDGIARLSTGENDDRVTGIGKFIRKCRIDELPQLINIVKGDMSLVGPRPERPEIAEQYEQEMPEFRLRLQAKAGLTGLAQVYGKYNTTPYDKLLMDLQYIASPGIIKDFRIIFATIKILFSPESTEGISVGSTTAAENNCDVENEQTRRPVSRLEEGLCKSILANEEETSLRKEA